jgi:hypothetical protein
MTLVQNCQHKYLVLNHDVGCSFLVDSESDCSCQLVGIVDTFGDFSVKDIV